MSTTELTVPVLVVGAGPAGLTASLALRRYGIEHLLVEQYPGTAHTPRAHIVNQRTVEILRHLGIEDRFHAVATPQHLMANNLWVTSLAGREVARSETWGTSRERAGEYAATSPAPMANCPQTVFEPMLVQAARDAGADIRFDHAFESAESDEDGVTSTILNRVTGDRLVVRSQYVLGADGARSKVLANAGLAVEGPAGLAQAANIWFRADLTRYLAHRPGVLTWNVMPGPLPPLRLGTLICHKPFTEFVLAIMYDPATQKLTDLTEADQIARVRAAVGDDQLEVELKGLAGWQVNAQVAPRYSAGRFFCLGDAVHRHPPTNGLGLNMSVADAFNLSWKLALVLAGRADPTLLDTYSAERQPVGAQGVERAITSLGEMAAVEQALGFEPGQSTEDGWAALRGLDEPGPAGEARRAALRDAVALTDYQFNAHGVELGYRYHSTAIVEDDSPEPPSERDAQLYHTPTTRPGARLPHARLERDGVPLSTLDLVDGLDFALITGPGGQAWAEAARRAGAAAGVTVAVHVIGPDGLLDPYGEWAAVREIDTTGCVLVRPDRHIAWRAKTLEPDSLTDVVQQVLGRRALAATTAQ
ncbi:FAD-dependent monooxygenase [Kutzneria sp. NPDC052558]|uniref:FAD-dependent monooxygenase n=1 Tax=Kutzneria sp. NPDC052558 TaxID=3364121 RepID=UPI0037C9F4DC